MSWLAIAVNWKKGEPSSPVPRLSSSPLTRSACKLFYNCCWRGWVVSSVVWEPAQVTLSSLLQTLHSTYFLSKFLATCRLQSSHPGNRESAGCCYGHVLSLRMCWTEHFWPLFSLLLLWLLLSSHVISFPLPLSRSLPPSVCRLVISIVMLRIFDRKRMLLLICMSDSGFSAGNRPQPGGK